MGSSPVMDGPALGAGWVWAYVRGVREKPYIDAQYVVVRGARPRRWNPLQGLGPVQALLAVAFMLAGLGLIRWLIEGPVDTLTSWLLALCGLSGPGA
jgi:hypothetical protein